MTEGVSKNGAGDRASLRETGSDELGEGNFPARLDAALTLGELLPRYVFLEPLSLDRRVLELGLVGRNGGASASFLIRRGARSAVALDADPAAIQAARGKVEPGVRLVAGGPAEVPDAAFDLILVDQGDRLAKAPGILSQLQHKLAPGGFLCAALRNPAGVTLAQVARGQEREAPATYAALAEALAAAFPSVEVATQAVFLGYQLALAGAVDGAPSLDGSLAEPHEAAYFVFICGEAPSHLGEQVLVTLPPAPVAVAAAAREELREQLTLVQRRVDHAQGERERLEAELSAGRDELGALAAQLDQAQSAEQNLRRQLEGAEARSAEAEARHEQEGARLAEIEQALADAVKQGELLRIALQERVGELSAVRVAREDAEAQLRLMQSELAALEAERERLAEERARWRHDLETREGIEAERAQALQEARRAEELLLTREGEVQRLEAELSAAREEAQRALADRAGQLEQIERERSAAKEEAALEQVRAQEVAERLARLAESAEAAARERERLRALLDEVEMGRSAAQDRLAALVCELAERAEELERGRAAQQRLAQEVAVARRALDESERALEQARGERANERDELARSLQAGAEERAALADALTLAQEQAAVHQRGATSQAARAEALAGEREALLRDLDLAKDEAGRLAAQLAEREQGEQVLATEVETLRFRFEQDLGAAGRALEEERAVRARLEAELAAAQGEAQAQRGSAEAWERELDLLRAAVAQKEAQLSDVLETMQQESESLQGQAARTQQALAEAQAQLEEQARERESMTQRVAQLEQACAELQAAKEVASNEAASPDEGLVFQLQGAEIREQALQAERARLAQEVAELQALFKGREDELFTLRELAAHSEALRDKAESAEARASASEQELAAQRADQEKARAQLDEERRRQQEQVAFASARSGAEAKLLREVSERQATELKDLRVKWAKASVELTQLKSAHEALAKAEAEAREALSRLKEGQGIVAASDLKDVMGIDAAEVMRIKQRLRELESQLADRGQ